MFLNQLEKDTKNLFLELCKHAANSDNVFEEVEKEMMYAYCREMNMPEIIPEDEKPLDELIKSIRENSSEKERNIIILEILGLMNADSEYAKEEEEFVIKLVKDLEIKEGILSKISSLLAIYKTVCQEMYATVNGK